MKILIFCLFNLLTFIGVAQKPDLKIFDKYNELTKKENRCFIKIGKDSIGNMHYLYNKLAYKFLNYEKQHEYAIYVQTFSPTYRTTRKVGIFKNVKKISIWILNFETSNYYVSQYDVYDATMKYITGDVNDVFIKRKPDSGSIEEKVLKKAYKLFFKD